jgi:hypothetical protein
MLEPLYAKLAPVRRRQRWLLIVRTAVLGMLAGSLAGLALGVGRWLAGSPVLPWVGFAAVAAGPIVGALAGLLWGRSWRLAAAAVDGHYQLKDRAATALVFSGRPDATLLHRLQVQDAVEHLGQVQPRQVVPIRWPKLLPYAVGGMVLALVVLAWPIGSAEVQGGPLEPSANIVAEAERIQEDLKEFEDLARKEENKELEKLVQEIYQKAEEMKQPGVDEREALAKLSEMQAAITAQQAQYNTGLVDGQLQALGSALTAANATDGAGKALQEAKYDKAAEELEKLDEPELDRKEAKALEEKLKQVAKEMGDVGLGQMSEAVSEMAEGIKGGKGKMLKATRVLAKEVRNQARRKKVNELLNAELDKLKEGKCNCQNNGGPLGKKPEKSLNPSSNWGRSTSGNVIGEKTKMLSQHNLEQLTGNPGEGPSDIETTHSAEGRQQAGRSYRDVYKKYKKESDAVLDSEPIPLGQRQTIRKYFELIHPQNVDADKKDEPAMKP